MNVPEGLTTDEYLDMVLARVSRCYDMDQRPADLILRRNNPGDGTHYKIRIRHPDTCESQLHFSTNPAKTEAFLRGLEVAARGDIEHKAGPVESDE